MFYAGISLITLGVRNVSRSRAFYERAGWKSSRAASSAECAFFQLNNVALALYELAAFEAEIGAIPSSRDGPPLMALAQNHGSPASVDDAASRFVDAGGRLIKPGASTHWGGYTAIVADPDGHLWELAWNPAFALDADGTIELPP